MTRWPVIRHIRWAWHTYRLLKWWHEIGCHLGMHINQADEDYLDAIWRGDA